MCVTSVDAFSAKRGFEKSFGTAPLGRSHNPPLFLVSLKTRQKSPGPKQVPSTCVVPPTTWWRIAQRPWHMNLDITLVWHMTPEVVRTLQSNDCTPPRSLTFNSSPLKSYVFQPSFFRVCVKLRGCKYTFKRNSEGWQCLVDAGSLVGSTWDFPKSAKADWICYGRNCTQGWDSGSIQQLQCVGYHQVFQSNLSKEPWISMVLLTQGLSSQCQPDGIVVFKSAAKCVF